MTDSGKRLDAFCAEYADISRSNAARLIDEGYITVSGKSEPKKYMPTEKQRKIAPTLDYIARYYNTRIKNDELAAMAGLSTVYFRKLFTVIMGQSPADYVQSVRIGKAKEMLQSDYGSITDIAFSLGYLNIYDFSRVFKKYVGVSPKQYQEQVRR